MAIKEKERVAPPLNLHRILNVLTSVKIGIAESAEMNVYHLVYFMITTGLMAIGEAGELFCE